MKKFIWLLLCLFGMALHTNAQKEGLTDLTNFDPGYEGLEECPPPSIDVLTIIHYRDYAKVYMEIKGTNATFVSYQLAGEPGAPQQVPVKDGKVLFEKLAPNQHYYLRTLDACGKETAPMVIDTKTEPDEAISISTPFYNAITAYLRENKGEPFDKFLTNLESVSPYEKTAFIQQFFLKGAALTTDGGETVPPVPSGADGGEPTDCVCNSIRTSPMAFPANMNAVTKTITDYSQPGSGNTPTNLGGDGNTRTWFWLNNKGAAKWHNLWTEGYKSEKGVDYDKEMGWQDQAVTSYQQSWLRMTFLCLDGDRIPKECECNKTVKFWYRYDTRIKAVAELRYGTTGSKNSVAQTEDMALASFWEEANPASFEPLKMVIGRVESHCERTPNPGFWTNLTQLLGSAASLTLDVVAATQGQSNSFTPQQLAQISDKLKDYFNQIGTVINTPYYNPANCDNEAELPFSMEDAIIKTMRPNAPIVLAINTFDKMKAGGRRAWHSYARINSDFHITGVIDANAYDGTPVHCCSPKVATWILGSCDGDRSTDHLKVEVAEFLYLAGFNGLVPAPIGNGRIVPGEFGYLSERSSREECNKIVVNPGIVGGGETGGRSNEMLGSENASEAKNTFQSLSVWDVSGRMIAEFTAQDLQTGVNVRQLVNERLQGMTPGIYFVRQVQNGEMRTRKILVH